MTGFENLSQDEKKLLTKAMVNNNNQSEAECVPLKCICCETSAVCTVPNTFLTLYNIGISCDVNECKYYKEKNENIS